MNHCDKHSGLPGAVARDGSCAYCDPDGDAAAHELFRKLQWTGGVPVPPPRSTFGATEFVVPVRPVGDNFAVSPVQQQREREMLIKRRRVVDKAKQLIADNPLPEALLESQMELLRVLRRDEERKQLWLEALQSCLLPARVEMAERDAAERTKEYCDRIREIQIDVSKMADGWRSWPYERDFTAVVAASDEARKKAWTEFMAIPKDEMLPSGTATITAIDRHAGTVTFSSDESAFADALSRELEDSTERGCGRWRLNALQSELAAWTPKTDTGGTAFGVDYGVFGSSKLPDTPAQPALLALEGLCRSGLLNRDGARQALGCEPPDAWFEDEDEDEVEDDDLGGYRAVVGSVDGAEGSIKLHQSEDVMLFEPGDALYTRQDVLSALRKAGKYTRGTLLSERFIDALGQAYNDRGMDYMNTYDRMRAALTAVLDAEESLGTVSDIAARGRQ